MSLRILAQSRGTTLTLGKRVGFYFLWWKCCNSPKKALPAGCKAPLVLSVWCWQAPVCLCTFNSFPCPTSYFFYVFFFYVLAWFSFFIRPFVEANPTFSWAALLLCAVFRKQVVILNFVPKQASAFIPLSRPNWMIDLVGKCICTFCALVKVCLETLGWKLTLD